MNPEKVRYILDYFPHLRTREEALAWRHWSCLEKMSNSSPEHQERRRGMHLRQGWMTEDPEVLALLDDGIDALLNRTAERILRESEDQVFFNNCPKCGELTRTPKARQCRFCGHDWH